MKDIFTKEERELIEDTKNGMALWAWLEKKCNKETLTVIEILIEMEKRNNERILKLKK